MPLLLEDLAEETSAGNRRAAELLDAEARHLDEPSGHGPSSEENRRRAGESARQATEYALSRLPQAEGVWRLALRVLHKTPLGEEASRLLESVEDVFATGQRLVRASRALWKSAGQADSNCAELEQLDRAERRFQALAEEAKLARASRSSDWQPADPARFALGMSHAEEGKTISANDARSRFRHESV